MEIESAAITLQRPLRTLASRDERLERPEELGGNLGERDLRWRCDLAPTQLREERITLRPRLRPRPRLSVFILQTPFASAYPTS